MPTIKGLIHIGNIAFFSFIVLGVPNEAIL